MHPRSGFDQMFRSIALRAIWSIASSVRLHNKVNAIYALRERVETPLVFEPVALAWPSVSMVGLTWGSGRGAWDMRRRDLRALGAFRSFW